MNILRIIYDWPPPWDGLAAAPYEITKAQIKIGHNVTVFCGRWPFAGKLEIPKGSVVTAFWREPINGTLSFTTSVIVFFYYLWWRFKNKPDVIHAHGHFAIWIYLYRLIIKKVFKWTSEANIPMVVHFHNTISGRQNALETKGVNIKLISKYITYPLWRLSDKWSILCADACIFVGRENIDDAVKYYNADPKKCFLVETGVNTDLFIPVGIEEKYKTRKELSVDDHDKIILNHGAMVERKNIHLLVEALTYLPPHYKLFLVGPFIDSTYKDKINNLIATYNLKARILITGYTPYPEVPVAYQASNIFVLPSSFEGLPKVVMQGLSCNVPCLVSGFKVEENIQGLFYLDELDAKIIAKRIQEIVESNVQVDLQIISTKYSWVAKAKQINEIYENIIKK